MPALNSYTMLIISTVEKVVMEKVVMEKDYLLQKKNSANHTVGLEISETY